MKKIIATPKARKYIEDYHINTSNISASGDFNSFVYSDVVNKKIFKATKLAQSIANYYNIDLSHIQTTHNEIRKDDVLKCVNFTEITTMSTRRKVLAENNLNSLNNSAQYTLFSELDTTKLFEFYQNCKNEILNRFDIKITITDIFIYITSAALIRNNILNSMLVGEKVYTYNYTNIALAIDTDNNLTAPVIEGVNYMNLVQIAKKRLDLVTRTKANTIKPSELTNGTFTISNLGATDITYFTPILNYPQSAMLGIGRSEKKPIVVEDEIKIRTVTYFSLTVDHILIDGMQGAKFISTLKELISNPELIKKY